MGALKSKLTTLCHTDSSSASGPKVCRRRLQNSTRLSLFFCDKSRMKHIFNKSIKKILRNINSAAGYF